MTQKYQNIQQQVYRLTRIAYQKSTLSKLFGSTDKTIKSNVLEEDLLFKIDENSIYIKTI